MLILVSRVIFASTMDRIISTAGPAEFVFALSARHVITSPVFFDVGVAFRTWLGMRSGPRGKAIVRVRILALPLLKLVACGVTVPFYHAISTEGKFAFGADH